MSLKINNIAMIINKETIHEEFRKKKVKEVEADYKDEDGNWQSLKSIILPLNYAKEKPKMEFKLLIEERSKAFEIQKKLNQWNHKYTVCIMAMSPVGSDSLAVLIQRYKKEERRLGNGC